MKIGVSPTHSGLFCDYISFINIQFPCTNSRSVFGQLMFHIFNSWSVQQRFIFLSILFFLLPNCNNFAFSHIHHDLHTINDNRKYKQMLINQLAQSVRLSGLINVCTKARIKIRAEFMPAGNVLINLLFLLFLLLLLLCLFRLIHFLVANFVYYFFCLFWFGIVN